jgi:hypothetical protein
MPKPPRSITISSLIERQQVLHLRCIPCGKDRYLSPLEAVATYGGQIAFQELAAVLRARCGPKCNASVGASIRKSDEITIKKHVP